MYNKKTLGVVITIMNSGSWCKRKCCLLLLTSLNDTFNCINTLCTIEEETVFEQQFLNEGKVSVRGLMRRLVPELM